MLKQKCKLLKHMHETEKQDAKNGFYISITSNVKVGEALCSGPRGLLRAPTCSFSFSNDGNGPKGALKVKVAQG